MANEIEKRNEAFLIYQDENGIARVNVRFEGEDVWLNVEQMMKLFDASRQDVSYHINQIYAENEQDPERTRKNFLIVRQEGKRSVKRNMYHYNLDKNHGEERYMIHLSFNFFEYPFVYGHLRHSSKTHLRRFCADSALLILSCRLQRYEKVSKKPK